MSQPTRRPSLFGRSRTASTQSVGGAVGAPPLKSALSLRRLRVEDLPAVDSPDYQAFVDQVFRDGDALLNELSTWEKGKEFGEVSTASRPSRRGERQGWHYRLSKHSRSYDTFAPLLENHAENEQHYIEACQDVKLLQTVKDGEAAIYYNKYKQPFPISNRDFAHLILSREAEDKKSFVICQIPFEHNAAKPKRGTVRAAYASVERVRVLEDDSIEWIMVTTSEAGGNIPASLTDKVLPLQIAQDVPSFINWRDGKVPNGKKEKK